MKTVIILGSSRKNGNTEKIVKQLIKTTDWDLIDLTKYNFSYYDYEHRNKFDDFLPLMDKILNSYDIFIFATPVYWYSMSGIMKVFFDRLSDLITIEKDMGKRFTGKFMAALSTSGGSNLEDAFWLPFLHTAAYFNMYFIGGDHYVNGEDYQEKLQKFRSLISEVTKREKIL